MLGRNVLFITNLSSFLQHVDQINRLRTIGITKIIGFSMVHDLKITMSELVKSLSHSLPCGLHKKGGTSLKVKKGCHLGLSKVVWH